MFYLIPCDLNTSAFTQLLLPIISIGNQWGRPNSAPLVPMAIGCQPFVF